MPTLKQHSRQLYIKTVIGQECHSKKMNDTSKFHINKLNFAFLVISICRPKVCNSKIFLALRYFQNNKKNFKKGSEVKPFIMNLLLGLFTYETKNLNIAEEQNCNTVNQSIKFLGQYKIWLSAKHAQHKSLEE